MRNKIRAFLFFLTILPSSAFSVQYYVDNKHQGANDSNSCTSTSSPCLTIGHTMALLQPGDILNVREGIYRLVEQNVTSSFHAQTTASSFFTMQSYNGEKVQIYGSLSTANKTWQQYNSNVWRISAEFLETDPKGMFLGHRRIEHQSDLSGSPRKHDHVVKLITENTWTKADINGIQCLSENTGCYIYYYPPAGESPNSNIYELSQKSLSRISSDYTQVKGLEFYYTQPQPIFFEYADNLLLENNVFAHVSNGDDYSYGIRIWDSGGSLVKNNIVYDSKYWGGTSNSKGITFMVSDLDNPNIVEYNEIYDIPGRSAIGTKGGSSGLIVRYNYIHDVYNAFEPGGARCVWSHTNTDGCQSTDIEYRPAGDWQIYGNVVVNATYGLLIGSYQEGNRNNILRNNVFDNVDRPFNLGWNTESNGHQIYNNIFMNSETGIYLDNGSYGEDRFVSDFLDKYSSDNNIFFNNSEANIFSKTDWQGGTYYGTPYALAEFQSSFNRELNSQLTDPMLNSVFKPRKDSPVCRAGRAGEDIGAFPCGSGGFPWHMFLPLINAKTSNSEH